MIGEQMDLLSWCPKALVVLFPLEAQRGRVRMVADRIQDDSPDADAYWKRFLREARQEMTLLGLDAQARRQELLRFQAAVQRELDERNYLVNRSGGDAA